MADALIIKRAPNIASAIVYRVFSSELARGAYPRFGIRGSKLRNNLGVKSWLPFVTRIIIPTLYIAIARQILLLYII